MPGAWLGLNKYWLIVEHSDSAHLSTKYSKGYVLGNLCKAFSTQKTLQKLVTHLWDSKSFHSFFIHSTNIYLVLALCAVLEMSNSKTQVDCEEQLHTIFKLIKL